MIGTLKEEKRRQERFMKRCAIEFVAGGKKGIGISSNFSLSGLFIRTRARFAPGTTIDMLVHLHDGATTKLRGSIGRILSNGGGRSLENGIGVSIIDNDPSYRDCQKTPSF